MWNPWEWFKWFYEVVGHKHPAFSALGFVLAFATIGLLVWWRLDAQYKKDHGLDEVPVTTFIFLSLEPALGDSQVLPVSSATMRIENRSNEADHNVYVRLMAPRLKKVTVDSASRAKIIGGGQGLRLSSTADLEILIPELLPGEIRTVALDLALVPDRSENDEKWEASVHSDRDPKNSKATWPINSVTSPNISIFRLKYTLGPEISIPPKVQ